MDERTTAMKISLLVNSLLVCLLLCTKSIAQRSEYWREKPGTWLLNAGVGATRYAGDLAETGNLAHLQLGAATSIAAAYRVTQRLSLRAEAQLYYVYGWQKYTRNYYNNLSFNSLNPDVWAGVQFDFWRIDHRYKAIIPYVLAGVGVTYITPKARYKGQNYSLAPFQTEGVAYNRLPLIIRYGVGLPLHTTERLRFHLEGTYTHVLSDYFDDVSSVYIDRSHMTPLGSALTDRRAELSTTLNRPGEQRGNTGKNDGYFVLSGRLVFVMITPQQRNYRRMFGP